MIKLDIFVLANVETTGCSLAICAAFSSLVYDEGKRLSTYLGFAPGSFVLLPWAPTAGMLLKHFRDEFSGGMSYKEFDAAAASVPAGSEGLILLPHCAGAVSPDGIGIGSAGSLQRSATCFAARCSEPVRDW